MTATATTGAPTQGDALGLAFRVLSEPPPEVNMAEALAAAREHYGWEADADVVPLSGERDRNFRLALQGRTPLTLKFINAAEPAAETEMQVQVLHHLAAVGCPVAVPRAVATLDGASGFVWQRGQGAVRGRAYTFLAGMSAVQAPALAALRRAVGRTVAQVDTALREFRHAAVERVFPWDLMHLDVLAPLAQVLPEDPARRFVLDFLAQYRSEWRSRLAALPQQVIHGDLSKSNLLVDPKTPSRVQGVLDFGDMVYGPAVADLAVAASYHMGDARNPLAALADVVAGHEEVRTLSGDEHALLPVLVLARLVQRIVIPEWRAAQFPENRAYILRSNSSARALLDRLLPVWAPRGHVLIPISRSAT